MLNMNQVPEDQHKQIFMSVLDYYGFTTLGSAKWYLGGDEQESEEAQKEKVLAPVRLKSFNQWCDDLQVEAYLTTLVHTHILST